MLFIVLLRVRRTPYRHPRFDLGGLAVPSSSSSSPVMPSAHCFRVPASMLPPRHRYLENALRRSPNRSALTQFRPVGQPTIADRVIIPSHSRLPPSRHSDRRNDPRSEGGTDKHAKKEDGSADDKARRSAERRRFLVLVAGVHHPAGHGSITSMAPRHHDMHLIVAVSGTSRAQVAGACRRRQKARSLRSAFRRWRMPWSVVVGTGKLSGTQWHDRTEPRPDRRTDQRSAAGPSAWCDWRSPRRGGQ
jgi:hypothetical protein